MFPEQQISKLIIGSKVKLRFRYLSVLVYQGEIDIFCSTQRSRSRLPRLRKKSAVVLVSEALVRPNGLVPVSL